jgi:hypothetical protein
MLLCVLAGGLCGGCAAVAWTAAQFAPPKKVPPEYTFAEGERVLVMIDDAVESIDYEPIRGDLAGHINRLLEGNEAVGSTIEYVRLMNLMASAPDYYELAVHEVGRRLGADSVIFIEITDFQLRQSPSNPLWEGRLAARVRVVDVSEKSVVWPRGRGGYPVGPVELPARYAPEEAFGVEVAGALAAAAGEEIAELFYEHEVPVDTEEADQAP